MDVYQVTQLVGKRKREILGTFTIEQSAKDLAFTLCEGASAEINTITVFEGTYPEWEEAQLPSEAQKQAALESARAKLTPAEMRMLGLS